MAYYGIIEVLQRELSAVKVDVDSKPDVTVITFVDCGEVNLDRLRWQPNKALFRDVSMRLRKRQAGGYDVVVEVPKLQGYGYAWWQWLLLLVAAAVLAWGVKSAREACLTYAPNAPWCNKDAL
jgi:hypothetical protein